MAEVVLQAEIRKVKGKKAAKGLRRKGEIPAVYYIHGEDAISLTIDKGKFAVALHNEAQIVDLSFPDGKVLSSIIRDIQWDPVTVAPVHVDFMGVRMDETVTSEVPIHLAGEAKGVKDQGGILQFTFRTVEIECLPQDIPESIDLDVSELEIGGSLHVSDINFENGSILSDSASVVVSVVAPKLPEEDEEVVKEEGLEEEAGPESTEDAASE